LHFNTENKESEDAYRKQRRSLKAKKKNNHEQTQRENANNTLHNSNLTLNANKDSEINNVNDELLMSLVSVNTLFVCRWLFSALVPPSR
jgi:hypothetical protein